MRTVHHRDHLEKRFWHENHLRRGENGRLRGRSHGPHLSKYVSRRLLRWALYSTVITAMFGVKVVATHVERRRVSLTNSPDASCKKYGMADGK
jgi:hypothetical protein